MPIGRGLSAPPFLSLHGLNARISPPISSGCLDTASCPFQYYLTRRLGLRKSLRASTALVRGSWFHALQEVLSPSGQVPNSTFLSLLTKRRTELGEICKKQGISGDGLRKILDTETQDAQTARAWLEVSQHVPIRPNLSLHSYFQDHKWTLIARELLVSYSDPNFPGTPLVGRLDALYYNSLTNTLWVVDYKTCQEAPKVRLARCPIDFQTRHYLYILLSLHSEGILSEWLSLHCPDVPRDVALGGILHVAIQKCPLVFGTLDRPFSLDTSPFKSGPRKGQPRNEKVFSGEPSYERYLERTRDWYLSLNDYLHLAPIRNASTSDPETGPPINISHTSLDILDEDVLSEYTSQIHTIRELAFRNPVPNLFPRNSSTMHSFGSLTPFAPFYLTDPSQWPSIIQQEGFTVDHRYPSLHPSSPSTVGEPPPSTQEEAQAQEAQGT